MIAVSIKHILYIFFLLSIIDFMDNSASIDNIIDVYQIEQRG